MVDSPPTHNNIINHRISQDMEAALTKLVEMKQWSLEPNHIKTWVKATAARLRVMARHIQQARAKQVKWVADYPFSKEGGRKSLRLRRSMKMRIRRTRRRRRRRGGQGGAPVPLWLGP